MAKRRNRPKKRSNKTDGHAKSTQPPARSTQKEKQPAATDAHSTKKISEGNNLAVKRVPPIVTYGMNHKEKTEQLTKVLGHNNFQMEVVTVEL